MYPACHHFVLSKSMLSTVSKLQLEIAMVPSTLSGPAIAHSDRCAWEVLEWFPYIWVKINQSLHVLGRTAKLGFYASTSLPRCLQRRFGYVDQGDGTRTRTSQGKFYNNFNHQWESSCMLLVCVCTVDQSEQCESYCGDDRYGQVGLVRPQESGTNVRKNSLEAICRLV